MMKPILSTRLIGLIGLLLTGLISAAQAAEPQALQLRDLLRLASEQNRALAASRNSLEAARAGVRVAGAFPNPELEVLSGNSDARRPGAITGSTRSVGVTQPIDLPFVRSPRIASAEASARAAEAGYQASEAEILARVKLRYFELLRRMGEEKLAREDLDLMTQIRSRIALRVEQGESPRFELTKADTEFLNASKNSQAAALRVEQARAGLRQAVGDALPPNFAIAGELPGKSTLPPLAALIDEVRVRNPELAQFRAESERAARNLELEKAKRLPTVALKAARDTDPELQTNRAGISISIPLWDRRSGAVDQAIAEQARARNTLEAQEAQLLRGLESAYRLYEIAATQVTLLDESIVRSAQSTLRVAEAAYRNGERGILEVLDAQRVLRSARNELVAAKYELAAAITEIDRLRATPLLEERGSK